jgi:hypothetical protein
MHDYVNFLGICFIEQETRKISFVKENLLLVSSELLCFKLVNSLSPVMKFELSDFIRRPFFSPLKYKEVGE